MQKVLLIQLPIPQINFGKRTANVPLAGAWLKQSIDSDFDLQVDILPESISSYISDTALISYILDHKPEILGFSVFNWNLHRSIYLAGKIKEAYPVTVIFGGPEITLDNDALKTDAIDFLVYGEGEPVFKDILLKILNSGTCPGPRSGVHRNDELEKLRSIVSTKAYDAFQSAPSPYLSGFPEPEVDGLMYLETQRGCIYHCGFCYYNKSRKKIAEVDEKVILKAVQWAIDHNVPELCLVDPSLNSRPGLRSLLREISHLNKNRKLSINAEIRAEAIDSELADLFVDAGFTSFEIGLQSTNKKALEIMRRKTDLNQFLTGTALLKERGIIPKIDLIVGLPGDDLEGFRKSLMFVAENNLAEDIQVFPLSVLPGTAFRKNSRALGLVYDSFPPYSIRQTSTYSKDDIYLSFDYAESLFDVCLFPGPYLDISYENYLSDAHHLVDIPVNLKGRKYIRTMILNNKRSLKIIEETASHLTFPYQILIGQSLDDLEYICEVIKIVTRFSPFTPFEIIFMEPSVMPDTAKLLSAVNLFRPGYLDLYNTYQYNTPGNRSVLFTVVTENPKASFQGEMKRMVFWWHKKVLPDWKRIEALSEFDGILIDAKISELDIITWQDRMAGIADDLIYISFADIKLQKRWMRLTAMDEFSIIFLDD